jgi:hypothetical protein
VNVPFRPLVEGCRDFCKILECLADESLELGAILRTHLPSQNT